MMIPFAVIHFIQGVHPVFYLRSMVLLFSVYVFSLAFYQFLRLCHTLRTLYKQLLLINIVLVGLAIVALAWPFLSKILWYSNELTLIYNVRRLRLFTYEASYYSLLLAPIALYYYIKLLLLKLPDPLLTFLLVTIPLLLSLSFGVILGLILSLLFTILWSIRYLLTNKKFVYLFLGCTVLLLIGGYILLRFPDNFISLRLSKIFSGRDTSFQGRTIDSFYLGYKIAELKSIWFGAGPGQTKELGLELFRTYYNHPTLPVDEIRIPNAAGDTLASFGLVGLSLRMVLEIWFFFSTRVYNNYYRLSLFVFIFIYQFTGSYITNIVEYSIWIMAFYPGLMEEFDRSAIRHQYLAVRRPQKPITT